MAGKDGVGGKIARIREARKLSQAELAERSQVALGLRPADRGRRADPLAHAAHAHRAGARRAPGNVPGRRGAGRSRGHPQGADQADRALRRRLPARPGRPGLLLPGADKAGRHMEPFLIDIHPASARSYSSPPTRARSSSTCSTGEVEIALRQGRATGWRRGTASTTTRSSPTTCTRRRRRRPGSWPWCTRPSERQRRACSSSSRRSAPCWKRRSARHPRQGLHRLPRPRPALDLRRVRRARERLAKGLLAIGIGEGRPPRHLGHQRARLAHLLLRHRQDRRRRWSPSTPPTSSTSWTTWSSSRT